MSYRSNIPKIMRKMKENERKALEAVGFFVTREVKKRAPVDTGRLRSSYRHQVDLGQRNVKIGTDVQYSPYLEFGTSKQRAQPHLRPAMEENKNQIQKIVSEHLGRDLK